MKVLVISLLRLGDILLATSVIRTMKKQNPKARIHLLINTQFQTLASMIPNVEKVYAFDRQGLQDIIGSQDSNLLEAFYRVDDLVDQLQTEKYDQVFNLTHNRLSGWLTTLIGCPQTKGVTYGTNGRLSTGSSWFEYLNSTTEPSHKNTFHFVDVFHYGTGLESSDRKIDLVETVNGREYARKLFSDYQNKTKILIQPCTSEEKKSLSTDKWIESVKMIQKLNADAKVFVLGAPNEADKVNEICTKSESVPAICELDEVFSLLSKADLLISGDTSIKHLASATNIKIVEISIGSSEYTKTGAYKDNSVILQGLAPCAPCPHRSACSQPSHLCEEKITAELISMVALAKLRNDDSALRLLAHEFRDEVLVLKTKINKNGDWAAIPLGKDFTNQEINSWVDRASFKLLMQKAYDKPVGEFGTEGVEIRQILETIYPDRQKYEWVEELSHLEKDLLWFEGQIEGFLAKLKTTLSQYQQEGVLDKFYSEITEFFERSSGTHAFESYCHMMKVNGLSVTRHDEPFTAIKKLREQLVQAHQRSKIELKLIRGLQTDFREGT